MNGEPREAGAQAGAGRLESRPHCPALAEAALAGGSGCSDSRGPTAKSKSPTNTVAHWITGAMDQRSLTLISSLYHSYGLGSAQWGRKYAAPLREVGVVADEYRTLLNFAAKATVQPASGREKGTADSERGITFFPCDSWHLVMLSALYEWRHQVGC